MRLRLEHRSRQSPRPRQAQAAAFIGPLRALALLLALAAPSLAEEPPPELDTATLKQLSLEDLTQLEVPTVVGASQYAQRITDAPSAVSIVTREDIRAYGYKTVAEILNGVRGLDVITDRLYFFPGVRGVNRLGDFGGRLLVTINGHRVNEPIYDQAGLGQDFSVDVDLIERVEVIRGPGSSLYGNNAFFGVVNVVTRQGRDVGGHGVEAVGEFGSFDAHKGRLTYGRKFENGAEVLLSGSYYASAGNPSLHWDDPEYAASNGGTVEGRDGESARSFFASLAYRGFTLEGGYYRRDKDIANAAYSSVFNDRRTKLFDEFAHAELRYHLDLGPDWDTTARVYFDRSSYAGVFPYDYGDPASPGITLNYDTIMENYWGGELRTTKTLWNDHRVTVGLEGRHNTDINLVNRDLRPAYTYIDLSTNNASLGAFVQDEFHILDNLVLNVGLRYDYFTTVGSTVNPRAALIYQPWSATSFKLLYGQAYRAPNVYEFSYENAEYKANSSLKPETIRAYELVWEQSFAHNYRLTTAAFYNQVKDLITQGTNPDPSDQRAIFANTDAVDVKGAEIELEARWQNGVRARGSYSFADATDTRTGKTLTNSPKHLGKVQVTVPLYPEKAFAGLELLATSSRTTKGGHTIPARVIANLTLFSTKILDNVEASASIYNLFDQAYRDPAAPDFVQDTNPRDGRTFRLQLTLRF